MKKVLVVFLFVAMTLVAFIGCSRDEAKDETQIAEARAKAKANVNPPGEFPFVKEPITLKIMVGQRVDVEDMETNEFTKKMADWGINIEWSTVPEINVDEKINLILATGEDLPDIFMNCNVRMPQQTEFGEAGVFINMLPYFDEYAPNILKMFEETPLTKTTITAQDGNIYGMGYYAETYHVKFKTKLWMNSTWLDAVDMKLPTTTDELYDVLVAFKNDDPNGNGKQDEIILSGSTNGWEQRIVPFMMAPFIEYRKIQAMEEQIAFRIVDDEIDFSFDEPEWKEGLLWLNKLYKEGLIDPLSFTQDDQQLKTAVNNEENLVGAVAAGASGGFAGEAVRDKYIAVAPLLGSDGNQFTQYDPISARIGHFVITRECENIEAAIRMLDYFMSEEGTLIGSIGQEGRDWEYVTDPTLLGINGEPAVYNRILKHAKQQNVSWSQQLPIYLPNRLRNGMLAEEGGLEPILYAETEEKYAPAGNGQYLLPFVIKTEYNREYVDIITPMQEYLEEFTAQAITGAVDIDKEWDNYLKTLESMNYERLLEMINESYIAQYGRIDLWNEN